MFRMTTVKVTAVGLALTALASVARAETIELTDAQMEQITAGAFQVVPGTFNLVDNRQITYTFRPATLDFTDNSAAVWTPVAVYWYPSGSIAYGVLTNAAGQTWDGGFTVTTGPVSGTPGQVVVLNGPMWSQVTVSGTPTKVL
jgi:hypothetical protein